MNSTPLLLTLLFSASLPLQAAWTLNDNPARDLPGRAVEIRQADQQVASFIYGTGQMKPYLHVFGPDGTRLTNPGLDAAGKQLGRYPHHRGLFIGWKVQCDLGSFDLWHMTGKTRMEVVELEQLSGEQDQATLRARVEWRVGDNFDLLITETRELKFKRAAGQPLQIDTRFVLEPSRDLELVGDLQHSGVHFRAAAEVVDRARETSYLYEPTTLTKGNDLRWCRLLFPVGKSWYTCQQLNAPSNPVEELSTRDYGRFGYFFRKPLKAGQPLSLTYRFIIEATDPPAQPGQQSGAELARARPQCEERYQAFTDALDPAEGATP